MGGRRKLGHHSVGYLCLSIEAGLLGKSESLMLKEMTSFYGNEVVDAMLLEKASKLQICYDRTLNRHRWVGRKF